MRWPHVAAIFLSVVTQRSSTAFIVLYEAAPTSFQPIPWQWLPCIFAQEHVCMLNKAYICIIFFFILKIICQIYLVLPMHYYLHLNCMRRQLLTTWSEGSIEGYLQRPLTVLKYWDTFKKWDWAWYVNQHNTRDIPARAPLSGNDVCWLYTSGGGQRLVFKMTGTAVVLQLISFFFCCGTNLGKADSEPKRFTSARSVVVVTKANSL